MIEMIRNPQKPELVYKSVTMAWDGEESPFEDKTKFPDGAASTAHVEAMHDKSKRGLKNWVAARGGILDSINTPRALSAWYDDYPTPYNLYEVSDESRAIRGHYKRMVPKKEATANEIKFEELYREYGDWIETVLCPDYDKHGHVYTPNQPLEINVRKEVICGNPTTDYLGIPREGKGKNKREKAYWVGKVYIANKGIRRYSGDMASEIAEYFGVSRMTVFNSAKYARACDALGEGQPVQKNDILYHYVEGDTLKEYVRGKMVKPWENPDNYGGRKRLSWEGV